MKHARLNVVGCGRLGQAISTLFIAAGIVEEIHVCNRSHASADHAVAAIGTGVAHQSIGEMPPSTLWLISCGDEVIQAVAQRVAKEGGCLRDAIVFHCSGFLDSAVLESVRRAGAHVASVHPVRSFADREMAVRDFPGTFCGIEGDQSAQEILTEIFTTIGGRVFPLSSEGKILCHAGHVFASNYVVSLLECAHRLYRAAGIPEELSWCLMEPLVRSAVDNVVRLGPARALTGPIARGEAEVVKRQAVAVSQESAVSGELYRMLGRVAVEVARANGLPAERGEEILRGLQGCEVL
jgi:predicted short-subunit dehydrogenase-like oxidoreductase (DUF2520 family)